MGIPSFSRWLYEKYPRAILDAVDLSDIDSSGVRRLPDATLPNANGEFDNLYIDMNGVVHPCCHPEEGPAPKDEEEMLLRVREYLLFIFSIVRPRKLLFIALDGVAPRAKMNQQRSRRFHAAKEQMTSEELKAEMVLEWARRGKHVSPEALRASWDSNVITPGTPFMDKLAKNLRRFIKEQLAVNASWRGLRVLFSDSNVPGEGEHKIMRFIRVARSEADYDPNTRHCVHGLDADLFMLSLATHEPHFSLLREKMFDTKHTRCIHCNSSNHSNDNCPEKKFDNEEKKRVTFQFARIWVIREYLEYELRPNDPSQRKKWDLERAIDDFVFLCFFVGNDFLPHLPSLQIREGAIDFLMKLYQEDIANRGHYLTCDGKLNFDIVQQILEKIGIIETAIFKRRSESQRFFENRAKNLAPNTDKSPAFVSDWAPPKKQPHSSDLPQTQTRRQARLPSSAGGPNEASAVIGERLAATGDSEIGTKAYPSDWHWIKTLFIDAVKQRIGLRKQLFDEGNLEKAALRLKTTEPPLNTPRPPNADLANTENGFRLRVKRHLDGFFSEPLKSPLESPLSPSEPLKSPSESPLKSPSFSAAFKALTANGAAPAPGPDGVRLGQPGWKPRYYREKFGFSADAARPPPQFRELLSAYMRGLEWVYGYYCDRCPSWGWFYPFHYAPFASDLARLASWDRRLERGRPFAPLAQLMAVMPPRSSHCLPRELAALMCDAGGPLADFYPGDFALDLNGKRFEWQGVALLPFIDERRLLRAMGPAVRGLDAEERRRNAEGRAALFLRAEGEFFAGVERGFRRAERKLTKGLGKRGEKLGKMGKLKKMKKTGEKDGKNVEKNSEKNAEKSEKKSEKNGEKTAKKSEKLEKTLKKALKKAESDVFEIKSPAPATLPGRIAKPKAAAFSDGDAATRPPLVAELFYRPRHFSKPNFSGLLRGAQPPARALGAADFARVAAKRRFGSFRPEFLLKFAEPGVLDLFRRYGPSEPHNGNGGGFGQAWRPSFDAGRPPVQREPQRFDGGAGRPQLGDGRSMPQPRQAPGHRPIARDCSLRRNAECPRGSLPLRR